MGWLHLAKEDRGVSGINGVTDKMDIPGIQMVGTPCCGV